jgi:hypothetical protein
MLEFAMRKHGTLEHICNDNGPEFIAHAFQDWMQQRAIKMRYIKPRSPWENAYIEPFHDKLRDECLDREVFGSQAETRVVIEQWRLEYNEYRPHSSLGYDIPAKAATCSQRTHPQHQPKGAETTFMIRPTLGDRPLITCPVAQNDQYVALPPDKSNTAPVVNEQSSELSQATIAAASSVLPKRFIGIFDSM